jgi:hypothetical protein
MVWLMSGMLAKVRPTSFPPSHHTHSHTPEYKRMCWAPSSTHLPHSTYPALSQAQVHIQKLDMRDLAAVEALAGSLPTEFSEVRPHHFQWGLKGAEEGGVWFGEGGVVHACVGALICETRFKLVLLVVVPARQL